MSRPKFTPWVIAALVHCLAPAAALAQVAFVPQVGAFPNGVTLSATPVVSADRRYVRMTLAPQFTALEGFAAYQVPGAVSGSGLRSVLPGPTYRAGMDGVIGPGGYAGVPASRPDLMGFGAGPGIPPDFSGFSDAPPPQAGRKPARSGAARSKRSRAARGRR